MVLFNKFIYSSREDLNLLVHIFKSLKFKKHKLILSHTKKYPRSINQKSN